MQFLQQVRQERANMIHTARNVVGEILRIDPTYFRSKYQRANISELGELLRDTQNPEQGYPLWAAVLFPSRDCNSTQPFLVEELVAVSSRTYPTSTHINDHVLVAEDLSIRCLVIGRSAYREAYVEMCSLGDKKNDARYDCPCSNNCTSNFTLTISIT